MPWPVPAYGMSYQGRQVGDMRQGQPGRPVSSQLWGTRLCASLAMVAMAMRTPCCGGSAAGCDELCLLFSSPRLSCPRPQQSPSTKVEDHREH